jgi:hypothetical protein
VKPFGALRQVQYEIGAHGELGSFQLFHTIVYYLRIPVDE